MKNFVCKFIAMVALFHVNGTHANAAALNVFAAASLTDSLKEI